MYASDADWGCTNKSASMCLASPSDPNYSAMDQLTDSGQDWAVHNGKFQFKLVWDTGRVQEWKQSSNPMTYRRAGLRAGEGGGVEDYEAVAVVNTGCNWGGLEWSGGYSLLDGGLTGVGAHHGTRVRSNRRFHFAVGSHKAPSNSWITNDNIIVCGDYGKKGSSSFVELWVNHPAEL